MKVKAGDSISIDSEKAGVAARKGKILEVLEASYGTRYSVRWDDGHESVIHPIAGTARIESAPSRAGGRRKR